MHDPPYVPSAEKLIDYTFRQAARKAKGARSSKGPKDRRLMASEASRVKFIAAKLTGELRGIVKNYPSFEQLTPFEQGILDVRISRDKYKKSLGAIQWCAKKISSLENETMRQMYREKDPSPSKKFLGRCDSLVKQVAGAIDVVIEARQVFRKLPSVKDEPTLVVAGYPNAGKSTFVKNLTGSNVDIQSYPFTTKNILIGRRKVRHLVYQIIDSPGLLDRPLSERNKIELEAVLALQHLADWILFIFDPTQDIKIQASLYKELKKSFKVEITPSINKDDIADEEDIKKIRKSIKTPDAISFSAKDEKSCVKIFQQITSNKKED